MNVRGRGWGHCDADGLLHPTQTREVFCCTTPLWHSRVQKSNDGGNQISTTGGSSGGPPISTTKSSPAAYQPANKMGGRPTVKAHRALRSLGILCRRSAEERVRHLRCVLGSNRERVHGDGALVSGPRRCPPLFTIPRPLNNNSLTCTV